MQKLYYSISEVSEIVAEEQHILRYWEKEFNLLKPKKNRSGNRTYSEKDLQMIKSIKKFIREEKLSLKGAKEQLAKSFGNSEESLTISNLEKPLSSSNVLVNKSENNNQVLLQFIDFLKDLKKQIIL